MEQLKELHPDGTSNVYKILSAEYGGRLKERVIQIIRALDEIGEYSAVGLEYVVRLCGIGQRLDDLKVKTELWVRVVREYRKNVQIKLTALKRQVIEKRKEKRALL